MTLEQAYADFGSLETNIGLLNYFDRFDTVEDFDAPEFEYDFESPELAQLREIYSLESVSADRGGHDGVARLAEWVHGRLRPGGTPSINANAAAILEAASSGAHDGFSCDQYAVTLSELCMAIGIPARITVVDPFNPNQGGNHVVVHAWANDLDKWVMYDAQFNAFYTNDAGTPLHALELRDRLVQHLPINCCDRYDYYGHWPESVYRIFLAKCVFSFSSPVVNGFESNDPKARWVHLYPRGYDTLYRQIKNQRWYALRGGDSAVDFSVTQSDYEKLVSEASNWTLTTSSYGFTAKYPSPPERPRT